MSKTLTSQLKASLAEGSTTLARLYLITRRDGVTLRFTDHDSDIIRNGFTYSADTGLSVASITSSTNRTAQNTELRVVFGTGFVEELDCIRGVYDDANFAVRLVDYENIAYDQMDLMYGKLGSFENTHKGYGSFEVTSLFDRTRRQLGEVYSPECRADLGDARCKLSLATFQRTLTVTSGGGRGGCTGTISGGSLAAKYFVNGVCTWLTGQNAGRSIEVLFDPNSGTTRTLRFVLPMPFTIANGDTATLYRGCDKRIATCSEVFNNAVNFRGEPAVPGADFANGIPVTDEQPE